MRYLFTFIYTYTKEQFGFRETSITVGLQKNEKSYYPDPRSALCQTSKLVMKQVRNTKIEY
jgi:hypothetical protein